jgi:hypothetical protein
MSKNGQTQLSKKMIFIGKVCSVIGVLLGFTGIVIDLIQKQKWDVPLLAMSFVLVLNMTILFILSKQINKKV